MNKILVPLDGSALAERILAQVKRLLLREDAEVRLLRVVPEETPAASRRLEALCETLEEQGARASLALHRSPDPAEGILGYAERYKPSLLALSTHGRTGLKRWVRGSVCERVLRRSPFPLLVWNPFRDRREGVRKPRFGRILVPLDGSEASAGILSTVAELARLYEAKVTLFHATEVYPVAADFPVVQIPPEPKVMERMLDAYRRRLKGVSVGVKSVLGPPAASILDEARQSRADLVAMTTHGRSGLSRWAYGSVAEQVLRHCPHPVLLQRTAGFSEGAPAKAARV